MAEPYSLGPYKGELLLDLDGLFRVIRLAPPFPEASALEQAIRKSGIPTLVFMGVRACFIGTESTLWGPTDRAWEEALLGELCPKDPLSAEEAAEHAVQAKILATGTRSLEALGSDLMALELHLDRKLTLARQRKQFGLVAEIAKRLDELQEAKAKLTQAAEALRPFATRFGVAMANSGARTESRKRSPSGSSRGRGGTPQKTYRQPLLKALRDLGGKCTTAEALRQVYEQVKSKILLEDLELIEHRGRKKEPVWRNRARWEIAALKEEGLVQSGGHGTLVLTEAGRRYLEEHGDPS